MTEFLAYLQERSHVGETGCWLWHGGTSRSGRPQASFNRVRGPAQQLAYLLLRGSIPENHRVRTVCGSKSCVCPEHLVLTRVQTHFVFDADNIRSAARVNASTGCWEWTGLRNERGYGLIGASDGNVLMHRASYHVFNGPIDADKYVLHRCDNPPCVNPEHLYLGSKADNAKDCRERMRAYRDGKHYNAKLSVDAVRLIRSSSEADRLLAKQHGVSIASVRKIRAGQSWRHIA